MTVTTPGRTLTMCVVICVYTCDRWDDILAAVASVRSQKTAPEEIVVVVDHNPDLYSRLRAVLPDVTVVENRYQRGLSGRQEHRRRGDLQRRGGLPGRRCCGPPRLAGTPSRRLRRRVHRRCRRHHPAALGIRPASVVPRRVRLGPGLHVHRAGTRAGPKRPGRQRLLPSRGLLGGGRVPESTSAGPRRSVVPWAARRRSSASG